MYSLFTPMWASLTAKRIACIYFHTWSSFRLIGHRHFFCCCKKAVSGVRGKHVYHYIYTRTDTFILTPNQQVVSGSLLSQLLKNQHLALWLFPSKSVRREKEQIWQRDREQGKREMERERQTESVKTEKESDDSNCDHIPAIQGGSIQSNSSHQVILCGSVQRSVGRLWFVRVRAVDQASTHLQ